MVVTVKDRPEASRTTAFPQGPIRKLKADENDIFNGVCIFYPRQSHLLIMGIRAS